MSDKADIIVTNGRLMSFCDARGGTGGEALAITGDRIAALGSAAEIAALKGPDTVEIDAEGGTVLPGFIESHVHLFGGSAELDAVNLAGVRGEDRLTELARAEAARRPDDPVIFAVCADYPILGPGTEATRHDLDRVMPDRPFAMMAADHHTVWANTRALEAAGILHGGEAPGGEIVMGADGTATGALYEAGAFGHITALTPLGGRELLGYVTGEDPSPPATPAQRSTDKAVIAKGLRYCAEQGITTLHNMDGNRYQLELLAELDAAGDLLCRTQIPFHLKPHHPLERLDEAAEWACGFASDRLWSGRVKMFMDGVIESYTAFMLEPYPGRPETVGEALFEAEHFDAACVKADGHGLQISVHAIGSAAVRRTLDGYAAARRANGPRDARHRIEHVELVDMADLPRFAELGVIASMQPLHSPSGGLFPEPEPETIFREEELARAFAWRLIRDAGARMIFSTDWPVAPLPVMRSVQGAVARAPLTLPGWTDQRQTLVEALAGYTADGAYAEFTEDRKGRLAPGMLADVAVMSADLSSVAPEELGGVTARATIMGGRITHRL